MARKKSNRKKEIKKQYNNCYICDTPYHFQYDIYKKDNLISEKPICPNCEIQQQKEIYFIN